MGKYKNSLYQVQRFGNDLKNGKATHPENMDTTYKAGQLFINNNENDPAIFTIGDKGNVVRISGGGSIFDELFTPIYEGEVLKSIRANYDFWSVGGVSALGASGDSPGGTGGGIIQTVYGYGNLGGSFSNTNLTDTFNAYTINTINTRLKALENAGLVTTVSWADILNKPTTLSGFGITDAVSSSSLASTLINYVSLTGEQTISGLKTFSAGTILSNGTYLYAKDSAGTNQQMVHLSSGNYNYFGNTAYNTYILSNAANLIHNRAGIAYQIFDTYNYNSYVPTLTGIGASGTWAISISGNAATATLATWHGNSSNYQGYVGSFNNSAANVGLGTLITLPFLTSSAKMLSFTIRLYRTYVPIDIQCSGYLYSATDNWYSPRAIMIAGSTSVVVTMGKNSSGYAYVHIAGTDGYTGTAIIDVVAGHTGADLRTAWTITNQVAAPSDGVVALTTTVYPNITTGNYSSYALPLTGGTISGGLTVSGSISPGATNTYNIGSTTASWANGYFNNLRVGGYINTSYAISTSSFICNSWVRTVGATGWYNETYAGGIYMADTSYVRIYNGKMFHVSNTTDAGATGDASIYTLGGIRAARQIYSLSNIIAVGGVTALAESTSDGRLKENIRDFDAFSLLEKIGAPVQFDWNGKAKDHCKYLTNKTANYGLIAQDVQKVLPGFIEYHNGYLLVKYERLIPIMLKAEFELRKRVENLEKEVERLKSQMYGSCYRGHC